MASESSEEGIVFVTIDGQRHEVYPPGPDLWLMLAEVREALRTKGYLEEVWPDLFRGAALGLVAEHCCRLPGTRGNISPFPPPDGQRGDFLNPDGWKISIDNINAVIEIIDTWDTSYFYVASWSGFVRECAKRVLYRELQAERRLRLIREPHPELREEAEAEGRAEAAYSAPLPPDFYESDEEVAESPSPPLVVLGKQSEPPTVRGHTKNLLSVSQFNVISALLQAGAAGLSTDTLTIKSGHGGAVAILKRLHNSDPDWRSVILLPGGPGRRYRLAF